MFWQSGWSSENEELSRGILRASFMQTKLIDITVVCQWRQQKILIGHRGPVLLLGGAHTKLCLENNAYFVFITLRWGGNRGGHIFTCRGRGHPRAHFGSAPV